MHQLCQSWVMRNITTQVEEVFIKANLEAGLTGVVLKSSLSWRFSDVIKTGVWLVTRAAEPHLNPSWQREDCSCSRQIRTVLSSEQDTIWPRSLELLATLVTSPVTKREGLSLAVTCSPTYFTINLPPKTSSIIQFELELKELRLCFGNGRN